MKKKDSFSHKLGSWLDRDNVAGYVFILPFIIGLIVFTAIPFFTSLYLAFTNYNILSAPKWVGLDNFKKMFLEDDLFWTSFKVTFKFALIQVPIKLTVALLVALVLSRSNSATASSSPSTWAAALPSPCWGSSCSPPRALSTRCWASSVCRTAPPGWATPRPRWAP